MLRSSVTGRSVLRSARTVAVRYGIAGASVAGAMLVRLALDPFVADRQPYPTFYVAMMIAAWSGGRGPVLVAMVLGFAAAEWFFVVPRNTMSLLDPVGIGCYFVVGTAIALFSDVMQSARNQARRSAARALRKQKELEGQIAERERAEAERAALLRELETTSGRLQAVLHQMPAGVLIAEAPSARLVLANDQVRRIWPGPLISAPETNGYSDFPGLRPDGSPYRPHEWPLARALALGEVITDEEIRFLRPGSSPGTMCVNAAPIRGRDGQIIAAVAVFHDITDGKRAQEELQRAREELEGRVVERTAELARLNEALRREVADRRQAEGARSTLLDRLVGVQDEERTRIARELHDQIGQQLAVLKLGLESIEQGSHPCLRARLRELQGLTRRIGRDMHRIAWELGPSALGDEDLPSALADYAEEWSGLTGVPVRFRRSGFWGTRLPEPVETTLYRVVQEALSNVRKHSRARGVGLILERREDQVLVIVEDDGAGFDPDEARGMARANRRLGIDGMRWRLGRLGGALEIETNPRSGTTLFARIPLQPEAARTGDG